MSATTGDDVGSAPGAPAPPDPDVVPLGRVLDAFARDLEGASSDVVSALVRGWADVVGADLAGCAQPGSLREGVLTVLVDEPAAATALRQRAAELRRRLDAYCGPGAVRTITVRVRRR